MNVSKDKKIKPNDTINENTSVMVYGHIKIVDTATGEILVNKRARKS